MLPGSLTVSDESADVIEAEFKFRLREKTDRNPQVISAVDEFTVSEQVKKQDANFK